MPDVLKTRTLLAATVLLCAASAVAQTPEPDLSTDPHPLDSATVRSLASDTTALKQKFVDAVTTDRPLPVGTMAREIVGQYPHDINITRAVVAALAGIEEWPSVLVFDQAVYDADSTAVDTAYFRYLFAAYAHLGQRPRIAATAERVARQSPRTVRVLRSVYAALGDPAVGDWPTVLAVGPTLLAADSAQADTAYFRELFTAHARLGHLGQLAALVRQLAARRDTRLPAPAALLRLAFDAFGDVQAWPQVVATGEALAAADSMVRGDPVYSLRLATAYTSLRQPPRAAAVLARLTQRRSDDPSVWLTYAEALRQAGRQREAGEAVARAFRLERGDGRVENVPTLLWYAGELRRAGQLRAAHEAMQRAAALAPDDPAVRAAQRHGAQ